MLHQNDTLFQSSFEAVDSQQVVKPHKLTPAEVLSWMPRDATPAQLDSVIQHYFKPGEIHWSEQPETLRLPGQEWEKTFYDLIKSENYRDIYIAKTHFEHAEVEAKRTGRAGDPVPYTIAGDNIMTGLLLACFILALISFQKSRRMIERQLKYFFFVERAGKTTSITETSSELRSQFFMGLQTCLLVGIIYFFYVQHYVADLFVIEPYQVIGVLTAVTILYFAVKALLYALVNWTFFDSKKNEQWMKSFLFLTAAEGVVLFPLVMLQAYFNLSVRTACIYAILVVFLFKILAICKYYLIFFRQKKGFLQIILYLCALEIVPLALLFGVLELVVNNLKIIF
ncbi:MAG: DUF4271 domain-containing protein [Prevotella sp.]|nr:DUF4271 domain-containing protein [Prevotella sp.]